LKVNVDVCATAPILKNTTATATHFNPFMLGLHFVTTVNV